MNNILKLLENKSIDEISKILEKENLSIVKNDNSGSRNSGNYNSGNYNSGNYNSGYYNSGYYNSGSYNSGYYNSGYYNSGYYNSGNYNSGHYNSGFFNTTEPTVRLFNKDTTLLRSQLDIPYINLPLTEYDDKTKTLITRTYKEAWKLAWSKLNSETKDMFKNLPNFNSDIFEEITGINIKQEYDKEYGIDFLEKLKD